MVSFETEKERKKKEGKKTATITNPTYLCHMHCPGIKVTPRELKHCCKS